MYFGVILETNIGTLCFVGGCREGLEGAPERLQMLVSIFEKMRGGSAVESGPPESLKPFQKLEIRRVCEGTEVFCLPEGVDTKSCSQI